MLGEPDDLGTGARLELGERLQLLVLGLLELDVHRPAVRAAVGIAQLLRDPLDHVVGKRVAEQVRLLVRLSGGVAHEVGEEPLDDAMAAHDALGDLAALGREDRLLVVAALHQPLGLEPLEHLARRRA